MDTPETQATRVQMPRLSVPVLPEQYEDVRLAAVLAGTDMATYVRDRVLPDAMAAAKKARRAVKRSSLATTGAR